MAIGIVLVLSFSTVVVAYSSGFFTSSAKIANKVQVGEVNVKVKEEIDRWKKDVGINIPKGTSNCWVRVYISDPTSLDGSKIYKRNQYEDKSYYEGKEFSECWKTYGDGYYYFYREIKKNEKEDQVLNLYKTIEMNSEFIQLQKKNEALKDGSYDLIIYAETVQSDGESSPPEAFAKLKK